MDEKGQTDSFFGGRNDSMGRGEGDDCSKKEGNGRQVKVTGVAGGERLRKNVRINPL